MRTIKTGICILICLSIGYALQYYWPVYACVAAIVSLQESPEKSFQIGFARIIGTLIGGLLGILLLWVHLLVPKTAFIIPLSTAAVILALVICVAIKKTQACSIAAITVLSITLIQFDIPGGAYYNAVIRLLENVMGVSVAVLVNRFIWFKKSPAREAVEETPEREAVEETPETNPEENIPESDSPSGKR